MENWKWVSGFENMYKVSDKGNVYSEKTKKMLSAKRITKDGYNHVGLRKNGKQYDFKTHRLVATHFIPNPENKETVNHIDGNKQNNTVENLEWATREENMQHAYGMGLKRMHRGCEHASSKLTMDQIAEIKNRYQKRKRGCSSLALGKEYGVDSSTILRIVKGERYV